MIKKSAYLTAHVLVRKGQNTTAPMSLSRHKNPSNRLKSLILKYKEILFSDGYARFILVVDHK